MDSMDKKKKAANGNLKQVEEVLKAFLGLEKDDAPFDELFQKIKLLYDSMKGIEKEELFKAIIEQLEVRKEEIEPFIDALLKCDQDDPKWPVLLAELRNRSYSPRMKLFQKVSRSPGGLKFLLDFRGDLLSVRRYSELNLDPLDLDIIFLFEMWFQEGFLYLEEITFDSAYTQIELIKNRDLVHPMASIEEMGQRIGRDRRCFALYHRLLPYEPIIFIEVALTEGLAKNISEVMPEAGGEKESRRVDTAIFYSINSTQNGLAGLGLGKILIGKVVDYIRKEDEKIKNFATLSPVPGFWNTYLKPLLEGRDETFILKHTGIISYFSKKAAEDILDRVGGGKYEPDQLNAALLNILSDEAWAQDEALKKDLKSPLVNIAYHYIANEKSPQNKPLNPVANFHIGNGATVSAKNVNFLANPSSRGLQESCGIMVNYIYTSSWLSQIRRSFRLFDRIEIKGLFTR